MACLAKKGYGWMCTMDEKRASLYTSRVARRETIYVGYIQQELYLI